MNLAFALNTYNQTKASSESSKNDGYEAVKYALDQVIGSMERLNSGLDTEEKEHHFERALSSIYFLQKCLDFEKGGDLAKNLFKVYEFCRVQIVEFALKGTVKKLDTAIIAQGTYNILCLFVNYIYFVFNHFYSEIYELNNSNTYTEDSSLLA